MVVLCIATGVGVPIYNGLSTLAWVAIINTTSFINMRSALYTLITHNSYINTDDVHLLACLNCPACKLAAEPVIAGLNFVNQRLYLTLQKSISDWRMTHQ